MAQHMVKDSTMELHLRLPCSWQGPVHLGRLPLLPRDISWKYTGQKVKGGNDMLVFFASIILISNSLRILPSPGQRTTDSEPLLSGCYLYLIVVFQLFLF